MRIGFDAKRYFLNQTGLGNYSRDLIRILETYHPENDYIKYTPQLTQLYDNNYTPGTLKTPENMLDKLFPDLWRRSWIVKDLKFDKIDIFHGLSGEIPIGLKKNNIKSVVTIHDLIFLRYPELYSTVDRMLYNKKFKYAAHHADKIVAISQQTKQDIIEFYRIPEKKIDVIYQGCHPAFKIKKTEEQRQIIRKKYNLPQNFLLNVGSIESRKNAFQIVKAIEQMDIPLLIIGKETSYAQEIKKYVQQKDLAKRIFIRHGFTMEELSIIYAMADIFVYPSRYEGFGIPIIEALYSGTPVITTKCGVFPEAGGAFSYYVDPEKIDEISEAIKSVLSNSIMRQEMVDNGLEYVQRFNDDTIAAQWDVLYRDLILT